MRAVSLDPQQVVLRKGQRPVRRAELSEDINVTIWNKFVFLTGLSAMTALTGHPVGRLREDPDTRELLEQIMNEALRVAQASGVPTRDAVVAERLQFIDGLPAQIRASMAIDRAAGRQLELPWLSGAVVRKGPSSAYQRQQIASSAKHSSWTLWVFNTSGRLGPAMAHKRHAANCPPDYIRNFGTWVRSDYLPPYWSHWERVASPARRPVFQLSVG